MEPFKDRKIAQVFTAARILNFEDMSTLVMKKNVIDEGRIKINLVDIDKETKKSQQRLWHYADTDRFLLACDDIINERFASNGNAWLPVCEEHKGGLGVKIGKPEWEYYASHFVIEYFESTKGKGIKVSLTWCEGIKAPTGIFKPLNHDNEVKSSIIITLADFRKVADKIKRQIGNVQLCLLLGCGGEIPDYAPYRAQVQEPDESEIPDYIPDYN